MLARLTTAAFFAFLMLGLGGCNTMEGAGQDIQRAGEELEEAAR